MRTVAQEKIWVNEKTNFHYIVRGIERIPPGSKVRIAECNNGIITSEGLLKGTVALGLVDMSGQMVAWSYDPDDLVLFAIEHEWEMDNNVFRELLDDLSEPTPQTPPADLEGEGS
jgi:hypothetical protein